MKIVGSALILLGLMLQVAHAGDWLWTNPATGAARNARGPGNHVDTFGRTFHDTPSNAWVFEPVQPNAYGLGVGSDALGRPVVPTYNDPAGVTGSGSGE